MSFSVLALQIIILLIPGIIHRKFYGCLQLNKERKDWEDYFEMIFISFLCYVIYSLFTSVNVSINPLVMGFRYKEASSLIIISAQTITVNLIEVFWASIIGIILAYLFSYVKKENIINLIGVEKEQTTTKKPVHRPPSQIKNK